ncbi:hypothetical protein COF74_06500 [Bacillus wiedmannii]|nr:hypothetical protein BK729_17635 [Bacillus thuringiensis serovar wratislaviensis]PEP21271.1 hypothetical protein CN580_22330 [Bacillus wiedmannii]PFY76947.1 hypothetical protein COL61_04300 [Bacillus wiedmannii]PHF11747.1 hypothetical protein COF74_06500 [Bacillus wiedmannii]PHF94789.1 hypothetical protein COI45_13185 [Bacillus wiedmannii]
MSENPFYTLPLYSKYYLYCIIAYMKEEMVDTTYGDVIIKFPYLSLEFLHYYAMIIYQYSTIFRKKYYIVALNIFQKQLCCA